METILIKIDLKSIKKNPNAGSTQTVIPGASTISLEITGDMPDYLIDGENCHIISRDYELKSRPKYKVLLKNDSLVEKLSKEKNVIITQERDLITSRHRPEPNYFFDYENTDVKCSDCGKKFKSNDFDSSESDGLNYSFTCCPFCGELDCCDVKYEEITAALLRKKTEIQ